MVSFTFEVVVSKQVIFMSYVLMLLLYYILYCIKEFIMGVCSVTMPCFRKVCKALMMNDE